MKFGTPNHTKMKRLCRRMDIPLYHGVGILESLWQVASQQARQGDIGKLSDEDIALAIDYRGDEGKLIEALIKSGWLDTDPTCRLIVHDWPDHCPDSVHRFLVRQGLKFANGSMPNLSVCTSHERKIAEHMYAMKDQNGTTVHHVPSKPPSEGFMFHQNGTLKSLPHLTSPHLLEQKNTDTRNCTAAAAAEGPWPETLAAARRRFPSTDPEMALRIAESVVLSIPDATDEEIAQAIEKTTEAKRSAGFYAGSTTRKSPLIGVVMTQRQDQSNRKPRVQVSDRDYWIDQWNKSPPNMRVEIEQQFPQWFENGEIRKRVG